jgi:hypothetical protein
MSAPPQPPPQLPPQIGGPLAVFKTLRAVLPVGLIVAGVVTIVNAQHQAPRDAAQAQVFAGDLSCARDLSKTPVAGRCRVVPVQVVVAEMREHAGTGHISSSHWPFVELRLSDGSRHSDDLIGDDGYTFVHQVRPGTAGRAQIFAGKPVRVSANGITADTANVPDNAVSGDSIAPWIGGVLIVFGLLTAVEMRVVFTRMFGPAAR